MTDDVLDLDSPPAGPAPRPRSAVVWTRGRTVVAVIALMVVGALALAFLLRPAPPPTPGVLGLQDGPVEAWRLERLPSGENTALVEGDRLLRSRVAQEDGSEVEVRLVGTATGDTVWHRTAAVPEGTPSILVADLPGTSWVAVVIDDEVQLWDRETGEPQGHLPLTGGSWMQHTPSRKA